MAFMKAFGLTLVLLLVLSMVPAVSSAPSQTTSITQTSSNLESTLNPVIVPYSIKPGQFTIDLGLITYKTTLQGFTWNATDEDSLTFGIPVGQSSSAILFNSSLTSLQFSGISLFFRPEGYQTSITITGSNLSPTQVCIPIGGEPSYNQTESPFQISSGSVKLDFSDIPPSMNPAFDSQTNQLCFLTPAGSYSIDPLAIDGTATCAAGVTNTCNMSLSTSNTNDIIIVISACASGSGCGLFSLPSASGLTFANRGVVCNLLYTGCAAVSGLLTGISEDYAISSLALSSKTITCTQAGNTNGKVSCVAFGVSGGNTGTPFDSHSGLPCTGDALTGSTASCVLSTSNGNDMIIGEMSGSGIRTGITYSGITTVAKCNSDNDGNGCSGYVVVSSTQTSLTDSISWTSGSSQWAFIGDAIQQAASTVTQPITITTLTADAPSGTITITGCSPVNSTFTADGFTHTYTLTQSCTVTLATSGTSGNTRYEWNLSPDPTAGTSLTFNTCASGTCSTYTNNTYYQLSQTYSCTPQTPTTWDGRYGCYASGTFLGVGSALTSIGHTVFGGGAISAGSVWDDYNLPVSLNSTLGNTWIAQSPSSFTQTTGGNTNNVNYIQSSGGAVVSGVNYLWLMVIPIFLIGVGIAAKKIR